MFTFPFAPWQVTVPPAQVWIILMVRPPEFKPILPSLSLPWECQHRNVSSRSSAGFLCSLNTLRLISHTSDYRQVHEDLAVFLKITALSSYNQMFGFFFASNHFWMCCLHPLPVVLISCAVYFRFALSLLCLILDTARDAAAQEMVKQLVGKWDNTKWRKCEKGKIHMWHVHSMGNWFLWRLCTQRICMKTNWIGKNNGKRVSRSG